MNAAVALALLIGVFLRHHTPFQIAALTGWSAGGIFFVSGALLDVLLSLILVLFFWSAPRSIWRNLSLLAVGIMIVESAMMAICYMGGNAAPVGTERCDYMTGGPVAATFIILECAAAVVVLWNWRRNRA